MYGAAYLLGMITEKIKPSPNAEKLYLDLHAFPNKGLRAHAYQIKHVYVKHNRLIFICFHENDNPHEHWDIIDLDLTEQSYTFLGEFYDEKAALNFMSIATAAPISFWY